MKYLINVAYKKMHTFEAECRGADEEGARQFNGGRKLVKTHQNVLVFCKGDWRKATEAAGGSFE